jgi:hypothetical protein
MDNFIIGTFRENINLLFHNLHLIQDTIPKKLSHLTDLAGKWTVNANGDIVPEISGTLNIGSIDKSVKSLFLSENSLHIVKPSTNGDKVSVKFGVSEDNGLEITQETLSDTQSDGSLQQVKSDPLTVPSKTQLLFTESENKILINAVKTVENTGVNFTTIINASNDNITADTSGIYIAPLAEYNQTSLLNDNIDLHPLYYNPNTKEMFSSDGSGHFIDLNVSGIIKGPAELIIDPSPVFDNAGTVRIKGNLIVDGTQTVINSNVLQIEDNIISIKGSNQVSSGIEIKNEGNILASFSYNGNSDVWKTDNKDLDIGTGNLVVKDISASSIGKVLLNGIIDTDEEITITVNDILSEQNVNVETGILCVTLVDSSTRSGSTGMYLATKVYDDFFYTVLLEKNTGSSILNFASETGILIIQSANSGVSYEIKKININKSLN